VGSPDERHDEMNRTAPAALALLLGLTLSGCASDDAASGPATASESAMAQEPSAIAKESSESAMPAQPGGSAMAEEGAWTDLGAYEADAATFHAAGDVVLFFNASWCPTCQAAVRSLEADGVPAGLTVVSVDYDSATDLRKAYGVTVQHTYVQVDEAGRQQAKWTGSVSGQDIADRTV
jgi:thiol-disulfide isomerase/thioredoxin